MTGPIKSPLLASTIDASSEASIKQHLKKAVWPLYVSPKIDGIRALVINLDGKPTVVSRSMKPIPNKYVQQSFGKAELVGLDGELIVGKPTASDCFRRTSSVVMSKEMFNTITFFIFDRFDTPQDSFKKRYSSIISFDSWPFVQLLAQREVNNVAELLRWEQEWVNQGYEGIMIREQQAKYKFGRSKPKEFRLMKLKRFTDAEAEVIGVKELMHNNNPSNTDLRGYAVRQTLNKNMVPANTLGALVVKDIKTRKIFNVGTGFIQSQRDSIWAARDEIIGKIITYKSFMYGKKDKPRLPVFKGFRED